MAEIPEDIKENMKALSKAKNVPIKDLMTQLKKIIDENEDVRAIENPNFKIRSAYAVLYLDYSSVRGQDCLFSILLHTSPRYITKDKPVADVSALVKPLADEKGEKIEYETPEEGWQYAAGTVWRNGAKNLEDVEVGKIYQTTIGLLDTYTTEEDNKKIKKERVWGLGILASNSKFVESTEKVPDFKKFFDENIDEKFEIIGLADIDENESAHETDFRVIRVSVLTGDVGEREDGTTYGYYDVMDNSIPGETRRVYLDKRDYQFAQGSVLLMGVIIKNIAADDKEPIYRMNLQWILPEIADVISFDKTLSEKTEEIVLDEGEEEETTEEVAEPPKEETKGKGEDTDFSFDMG